MGPQQLYVDDINNCQKKMQIKKIIIFFIYLYFILRSNTNKIYMFVFI